jgi:hypothetical protein
MGYSQSPLKVEEGARVKFLFDNLSACRDNR